MTEEWRLEKWNKFEGADDPKDISYISCIASISCFSCILDYQVLEAYYNCIFVDVHVKYASYCVSSSVMHSEDVRLKDVWCLGKQDLRCPPWVVHRRK